MRSSSGLCRELSRSKCGQCIDSRTGSREAEMTVIVPLIALMLMEVVLAVTEVAMAEGAIEPLMHHVKVQAACRAAPSQVVARNA